MRSVLLKLIGSIVFILTSFECAVAVDDPALCTEPYEVERRCREDGAPQVLSLLIAGSTNPDGSLANVVNEWRQEGSIGIAIGNEIERLAGKEILADYDTSSVSESEQVDRDRLVKLCVLQAGQLCQVQVKNPSLATSSVEICPNGDCLSQQTSCLCGPPIISGEDAALALIRSLNGVPDTIDETVACEANECQELLTMSTQSSPDQLQRQAPQDSEEAAKLCLAITSLYPWQDEGNPASGGSNQAYNCRDASNAFIACMKKYGYEKGHTFRIEVMCNKCDDGTIKKHSLNMYKRPDGLICPVDPQASMTQTPNVDKYKDCCAQTASEAAACAERVHCGKERFDYLCCQPYGKPKIMDADKCTKERSYCQDSTGNYTCPPDPKKAIDPPPTEHSDCRSRMVWCYANTPPQQACQKCGYWKLCGIKSWFWSWFW